MLKTVLNKFNSLSWSPSVCRRPLSSRKMTDKLVWIDCEMTGLDIEKDRLLEIALLITDENFNHLDSLGSIYISTPQSVLDSMNDWCKKHFSVNGLNEQCLKSVTSIEEADLMLDDFMKRNKLKNGILAGNSISTDRLFINKYCPRFASNLHYRMVDVSSIKILVNAWYKDKTFMSKSTQHRAMSDIMDSIEELKYYKTNYFKN